MTATAFLQKIWPQNGSYYALVRIGHDGKPKQHFLKPEQFDQITRIQNQAFNARENLYMALFSFDERKRKQERAERVQCLFLDLDVGVSTPEKPKYLSQTQALFALQKFCEIAQLPRPSFLINSGAGIHVYWTFDTSLSRAEWQPLANGLFDAAVQHKFLFDTSCTKDSARILRLPGSQNWKYSTPLSVTVLHEGNAYPVHRFNHLLAAQTIAIPKATATYDLTLSATLAQVGSRPKHFKNILTRCVQNTGCAQLLISVKNRTAESEPLWRAALSIAKYCEDGLVAIHKISQGHPDYNPDTTQQKSDLIVGPYKCKSFNDLRPGLCETCPHWNRITSPIQLGDTVAAENPTGIAPAIREEHREAAVGRRAMEYVLKNEPIPSDTTPTPFPYVISTEGDTYRLISDEEAAELTKAKKTISYLNGNAVVKEYPGHLRLIGRGYDEESGDETIQIATKIGCQSSRYANVPAKEIAGRDTLRRAVGGGAILDESDNRFIRTYLKHTIREDSKNRDATKIIRQLGWTEENSSFVLGRHAIHRDGAVTNVIPSQTLDALLANTSVKGSPQHWVRMADYWNRQEHLGMAFTLLSTFGAPLLALLNMGVAGALIHLFSPDSGIGKSAIQAMICAAYGNPKSLMFTPQDTINATLNRLGLYHTIPVCMDEITNHPPEQMSQMVYQITQGREKLRLKPDASGVRSASGQWCTTVVTSGNASIMDKLFSIKSSPEGELMRFIEIRPTVQLSGIITLSEVMDGIDSNFGSVGAMYAYYIVTQRPKIIGLLAEVRARLRKVAILGEAQRFWLALLTANIAGGLIAKDLGFINFDMFAVEQWAVEFVSGHQKAITSRKLMPENVFHDIIAKHSQSAVINALNGMPQIPRNAPVMRLDLKLSTLAISMTVLTQEAQRVQVAIPDVTQYLNSDTYQYDKTIIVNLTDGLPLNLFPPTPVRCAVYKIDPTLLDISFEPDTTNVVSIGARK